jgi:hypothetical protein
MTYLTLHSEPGVDGEAGGLTKIGGVPAPRPEEGGHEHTRTLGRLIDFRRSQTPTTPLTAGRGPSPRACVRYWCGMARGGPWCGPGLGSYRQAGWLRARLPATGEPSASAVRARSDSTRASRAVGYSPLLRVAHVRRLVADRRCVAERGCSGAGGSLVIPGRPVGRCVQARRKPRGCHRGNSPSLRLAKTLAPIVARRGSSRAVGPARRG